MAKADDRVKAAKPDDLVASVVKVDVADDPVRGAAAAAGLAKAEAEVVDLAKVDKAADVSVDRVADVDSLSRRLRSRPLWTLTRME